MARPRKHPVTNNALAVLLRETGWSMCTAAKMINETAERNGRRLRYRAPSVNHWLTGMRPSPEAIPVIVETFADALNRPDLTAEDMGWPSIVVESQVNPWVGDLFGWLSAISRRDLLDPRGSHSAGVYSTAYLSPQRLPRCRRSPEPAQLTRYDLREDVARLREGTEVLMGAHSAFGGGYAHTLGSSFLANQILPVLRASTDASRPDVLRTAFGITCLLGAMCEDTGSRARAQQYYILGLRLAAEAADPVALGFVCTQLAAQAAIAGRARAAWDLLSAADAMYEPPRYHICSGRAIAQAYLGKAEEAYADLAEAQRALECGDLTSLPRWLVALPHTTLEQATELVLMALGDLRGATSHLTAALAVRRPDDRLGRALTGIQLARVQVAAGDVDDAARTVELVAGDMAVTSARLAAEVTALREAWPTVVPVPPSTLTTPWPAHKRALISPAGAEAARIGEDVQGRPAATGLLPSGRGL